MATTRDLKSIRKQEMPSFFLPLAPATSAMTAPKADEAIPRPLARRSSSLSSDASDAGSKSPYRPPYRILKLAPVCLGEHADEHKADWHEVAVE